LADVQSKRGGGESSAKGLIPNNSQQTTASGPIKAHHLTRTRGEEEA
jgi:hypothetical protein